MKNTSIGLIALLLTTSLILAGCEAPTNQPANTNTAPTTNTNTAPAAATTPASQPASAMFTLPVLKAFLANETFKADVRQRLQVSDEQMRQLEAVVAKPEGAAAANTTAKAEDGESQTTSFEARQQAGERVNAILGAEKTQQLAALVDSYWKGTPPASGGSAPAAPAPATAAATPNSVPGDTRVIVNAPAYRMDVFEGGKLVKSYKVGIGYPEFPLPTGMRQAKEIIFNPTWTPPDEPWVEASDKVKVGEKVEAGSKLNPLGIAKIPIGLPSLIHGGKKPAQIGGFASHGCVGMTDAQLRDFVQVLADAGGSEVTEKDLATYAKDRTKTQSVKLQATVPVELRYETIVVEDGSLHIYRDVYDMNSNTEENLRRVLSAHGVTLEQLSADERAQVTTALKDMSRDAAGKLDSDIARAPAAANQNGNRSAANRSEPKDAGAKKVAENRNITRTVKGAKEVVIQIAALKGKGYPAPVALNTGGAPAKPAAAQPRRR